MKHKKINDGLWQITAPNGNYAHLTKCHDGWEVSCWSSNGQLLQHGSIHEGRWPAKIEAEKLLS